jgi:hypothetical protein
MPSPICLEIWKTWLQLQSRDYPVNRGRLGVGSAGLSAEGGAAAAAQLGHQSILQTTKAAALSEIASKRAGRAGCHQHVTTTQEEPSKEEMEDTTQSRAHSLASYTKVRQTSLKQSSYYQQ